ncbi:TPA: hypothetical protein N0F65_001819 [Lagenidium giganteum]|uniref:FYVE-type domain-containing protein n=1 Tax=Lagenidium giganteum TaxID=4803 RepID=A0AAV2Z5G4_9STRA|nr:TPA: hypothetical protein N0F65_001819 [Lagenidium giganteum]
MIESDMSDHDGSDALTVLEDVVVDTDTMTEKDKDRLTNMAKRMTEALLEATDLLGGIPWALVHEKHGISLFRADVATNVPCNVHAVCKFSCDIEDVAESMITNTTESYKKMMSMLSSDFLDGAVINNIVEPNELNPHRYVALKWAAFKSSSPFTRDRDFIILEYVDMIEDDQGQKVAFRIMESVDVPNNSPYAESSKYTRDIVPLIGFMYHTTKKPGELRMTYTCNFDKNGDLPAWAANSAIQSHVEKCVNGILKYIETFRAKKEAIVLPQQVISMSEQDHCHVCKKNFCVMRRRYNCLKCGEVICSSCSSLRNAQVPDVGERQLRVCTACVLEARRSSRNSNDSTVSTTASSSTASPAKTSRSKNGGDADGRAREGGGMVRSQSFRHQKRRSYDDVLEPVRSRLIEYKTFSDNVDNVTIPKASFPARSFSDGLVMRKGSLFGAKRRGSPADLAISLEAFRQHQMRTAASGNGDQVDDDASSLTDEESFRSLDSFSSSVTLGNAPKPGSPPSPADSPSNNSKTNNSSEMTHAREFRALERRQAMLAQHYPSTDLESRAKLNAAMEKAQGIIEAAQYANEMAQHARKLSHHRILALQREEQGLAPISNTCDSNQYQHLHGPPNTLPALQASPDVHVRRAVVHKKSGTMLYGKHGEPQYGSLCATKSMQDLQAGPEADPAYRRLCPSGQ